MAKLDFYFGTQKVNEDIANWRDLEIEVNFDDDTGQGAIKSGSLEFTGALADKINTWNDGGMTGGAGIFEAPPFKIQVCGSNDLVFDGGINTAECTTLYECDKVIAPLRANTIDFINDRATSFSFAYLASLPPNIPGKINQSDYVAVPYVINSVPDFVNVMVAGMSVYMMVKESREIIEKTKALIEELSGDTVMTTTSAVSVTAPTVSVGMAIGRVLIDIIRITFYILYLAFIINSIISLLKMISDNLIQPVKYKKGMRVKVLFQKACDYLGLPFSSTLLASAHHPNEVIIPRKTQLLTNQPIVQNVFGIGNSLHKDYDEAHNPVSTGFFEGTFADLILLEEQRLNAEIRIISGVLHFETKDYFAKYANYTLPDIQRKNGDPHGTNACELSSNYIISYSLDSQETNTYDQFAGTSCQMQLSPSVILNKKNVLLKNLTEITLNYSLAKRKEKLNAVEHIAKILYDIISTVYDAITEFINGIITIIETILNLISALTGGDPPDIPFIPPMPKNPFSNRIGVMLLSSDFIGIQKILVVDSSNRLAVNNVTLTSARNLMDELHYTNFAIRKITTTGTIKNDHNQWLTYADKEIPFCCGDYQSVLNNNFVKTFDQKTAKIKSLVWKPERGTANITYRVKQQYTNNLTQKYIIDGQ